MAVNKDKKLKLWNWNRNFHKKKITSWATLKLKDKLNAKTNWLKKKISYSSLLPFSGLQLFLFILGKLGFLVSCPHLVVFLPWVERALKSNCALFNLSQPLDMSLVPTSLNSSRRIKWEHTWIADLELEGGNMWPILVCFWVSWRWWRQGWVMVWRVKGRWVRLGFDQDKIKPVFY